MRRAAIWIAALVAAGVLTVGCSGKATTACKAPDYSVCVNGQQMELATDLKPHVHEGSLYAPVEVLSKQLHLDVQWNISTDGKEIKVLLNGKPFAPAMASGSKGIHAHNGHVFVPVKEFAAAAGLKVDLDTTHNTAGFAQ